MDETCDKEENFNVLWMPEDGKELRTGLDFKALGIWTKLGDWAIIEEAVCISV